MNKRWAWLMACVSVLGLATGAGTVFAQASCPECGKPQVFVETATEEVGLGQPIELVVGVENPTCSPLTLTFPSSYQADYTIDGQYTWSDGRAFTMALTQIEIPPGGSHVWRFRHDPKDFALPEGQHQISGRIVADNVSLDPASTTVEVVLRRQQPRVGDLWRAPQFYNGQTVQVFGEYRGQSPPPFSRISQLQPEQRTDWILRDETGEAYCENRPDAEVEVDLHPEWTQGVRVQVTAEVEYTAAGAPRLLPMLIRHRSGESGMFCVLEVASPGTEAPDGLLLRMIVKNDTGADVSLMYPSGITHDFVIVRDGEEVWRWSRHAGIGGGILRETIPAEPQGARGDGLIPEDNSRVFRTIWTKVDDRGRPVAPGLYEAWGVISRHVFTYPVVLEVGSGAGGNETGGA